MKIGFYFDNSKCENIDFSKPNEGNPGVGGVEYMFSLVSYYCSDYYETYVLTNHINHLSNKTKNIIINSIEEVFNYAEKIELDYLICRSFGEKQYYDLLNKCNCKVIIWAHNFTKLKELNWISRNRSIVKYICVGKEQYNMLNGHPIYSKSTYINNGLPLKSYVPTSTYRKSICYVGSIIKGKGFEKCCKVWRRLYDEGFKIPFNIIGSGKLYNSRKQLGELNLASPEYEKEFINYITRENHLLKEVNICGVLGHKEKVSIMNSSYFGISASNEETFGLIAVEFGSLGKPFVAINTLGFNSIIKNNINGYLVNDENELYNSCLRILKMSDDEYCNMYNNCIENSKQFDICNIIEEWKMLFENIQLNKCEDISIFNKISNYINLVINYH